MKVRKPGIAASLILEFGLVALGVAALPALAAPHASSLDVVVSEVAWMGTTASYHGEWIELYNNTGSPVDLAGWSLSTADGSPSISLNGTIPPGGHFLLERTNEDRDPGLVQLDGQQGLRQRRERAEHTNHIIAQCRALVRAIEALGTIAELLEI